MHELSPKKARAILALLSTPSVAQAAQHAACGERSLRRWLQQDDFRQAYKAAQEQALGQALGLLSQGCAAAVLTLRQIVYDDRAPASARVSAARAVLELTIQAISMQGLDERLAKLETLLREKEASHVLY